MLPIDSKYKEICSTDIGFIDLKLHYAERTIIYTDTAEEYMPTTDRIQAGEEVETDIDPGEKIH